MVRRIFAFEDQKLRQYEGGYTDYARKKSWEEQESGTSQSKNGGKGGPGQSQGGKAGKPKGPRKLKFTWQEQRDYETIEGEIQDLEEKIAGLEEAMNQAARDFVKLAELTGEKNELEAALEKKMERWMYLEDLEEKIRRQEE